MLDSRAPPGEKYNYQEQEAQAEQRIEEEAKRLMAEARLWRLANSAMWIAWGIVQAKVPGLPSFEKQETKGAGQEAAVLESATMEIKAEAAAEADAEGKNEGEAEDEEFDYLAYAQDRAMFAWGDAVGLGIVKAADLPEELRRKIKYVEY